MIPYQQQLLEILQAAAEAKPRDWLDSTPLEAAWEPGPGDQMKDGMRATGEVTTAFISQDVPGSF